MQHTVRAVMVLAISLGVAACGSSSDKGGSSKPKAAELSLAATKSAKGNVTFCVAKDTTGSIAESIKLFNAQPNGPKAKVFELPESQDDARAQVVQRFRAKSPECDVVAMDPTQIAEYVAQGWLRDLTGVVTPIKDQYIASTVDSTRYEGRYWAVPYVSDAGLLYYRTDKLSGAPKTWQEVYADAKDKGGYIYQASRYEGLTVHFLELLFSHGGEMLSADGKKSAVDGPQAREVLELMTGGIRSGAVPKSVLTYMEEETRRSFESGNAVIARNWPYAYALGQKSKMKGKFDVAPLPAWEGGTAAGILGGYDVGISKYSKNAAGALKFALFLGSAEAQRIAGERSFPPTRVEAYDDPAVRKVLPFADTLKEAVASARPRPVSPVYPQISAAISRHTYAALQGKETVDEAVKAMSADVEKALSTF
jgi:multiple sugar transport system substrate-binding protein